MSVKHYIGLPLYIDPQAKLAHSFDWSEWLETGAGIADFNITCNDSSVVIDSIVASEEFPGVISFMVSEVAAGVRAVITCEITTDEVPAQTDQRSFIIIGRNM